VPKVKVVTAYDQRFASVGDIAAKSIAVYAAANGLDFEILPMPTLDRPASWGKIALIANQFANCRADFLLWVDADACFVRTDRNIAEVIKDGKDFYLVSHHIQKTRPSPGIVMYAERPNMGVFLIRKSEWSLRFLNTIWQMTKYISHPWWENAAVMDLLGYRFELTGNLADNTLEERVLEKVDWLPLEWNALPCLGRVNELAYSAELFDPIIVHYAGVRMEEREPLMRALTISSRLS
jgi:hypothetical protein